MSEPIHCAGLDLREHRHICAFFSGPEEEHRVLAPFMREGIARGEKSVHIVDPADREPYMRRLEEVGATPERSGKGRQVEILEWSEAYLRGERFEQDAMLSLVEEVLSESKAQGYPLARLVAHMEWALSDLPGVDALVEYETRLNYLLPKYVDPVICAYDLSRFGTGIVMDVLRTHPVVLLGGMLRENPFYVPPDAFLAELAERKRARAS